MLIAEGVHKCITLKEVLDTEDFLLEKALGRNSGGLKPSIQTCLGGRLTKDTAKTEEVMASYYRLDRRIILTTELKVVNPHKGSLELSYKMMDWS